jgi:regulator of sirC expression with transglutaminase-like and TPR domain
VELIKRGKFPEALGISQKAILLNPRSGKGYYDLGLVYERMGNMKNAIHSYEQAMKHEPDGEYARRAREHVARLRKKAP